MNITTNNKLKLYWFCTKNPSKSCFLLPLWLEIEEVKWSMKKQWQNILIWYSYCLQRLLLYLQLLSNDVYDHRSNWFVHFSMVRFDPLFIAQKTSNKHDYHHHRQQFDYHTDINIAKYTTELMHHWAEYPFGEKQMVISERRTSVDGRKRHMKG